jgi:iron complex outermembrane recepter protein
MFASFNVGQKFELRMGVNNMFDRGLPTVASNQTGTDTAQYDLIGRAYYAGFKIKF